MGQIRLLHRIPSLPNIQASGKGQVEIHPLEDDGEERGDAGCIQFSGRGERCHFV